MSVIQLQQSKPCSDIPATLRRLADEIERGETEFSPVTTCVVVLGHTSSERLVDGELQEQADWSTYGMGPRCDTFTVRGLMASALRSWGK